MLLGGVIFFVCPSKTVGQPGTVSFFNIPKPAVHVDNHKLVNLISPAQFKYLTLGEGEDKKEFCASECFYMMPTLDYHHVKEKAEFCIYDIRGRMGANNHMIFIVDENQENNKLISGTAIVYCGPGISSDAISHKEAKELAQAIAKGEPNSYSRMLENNARAYEARKILLNRTKTMTEKLRTLTKKGLMGEPFVAQYLCPF